MPTVNNTTTVNDTIGGAALTLGASSGGVLVLNNNADSYTGVTNIAGGILRRQQSRGLERHAASIANGASLQLAGGFSEAEPITASLSAAPLKASTAATR